MTAPSNANTSGLEVVAWRKNVWVAEGIGTGWMLSNEQPEPNHQPTDIEPLVTAASAQARIDAAETRADRLAKALEAARGTLDAIDCPLTIDRTVAGAAKHAVKRIDTALQQETQK